MPNYVPLPTAASCPDVSWYEGLELPSGKTYITLRRERVKLDTIDRCNEHGQVVNIARQLGTDKENVQRIATSIKVKGILVDVQPPYLGTNNRLMDGYTRTESYFSVGLEYAVFNIVEPREGYTWQDVWDEIGLGANDHPPSKGSTREDFAKRLAAWIARQNEVPSIGECQNWVNAIPHSFTQAIVANMCSKVLEAARASATMEAVNDTIVKRRAKDEAVATAPIPVNISGDGTYIKRAAINALYAMSKGEQPIGITFTKGISADNVDAVREEGIKHIDELNEMFERAFQERLRRGENFKLLDVQYHMPQVIGQEHELIPVE